jgi:hypothetical protein
LSFGGGGQSVAANPFPEWLAEVAADEVVVRPDDIEAEARSNLWSFSLSPEQAAAVSVADVAAFAAGVADGRRTWLSAYGAGPIVMYWWHDAQAGQLRFGLVSASHGRLPFGCEVVPAASLAAVASDWPGSSTRHGIPLGALRLPAPEEVVPEPPPLVLPVRSVVLPQTPNQSPQPTSRA